MGTGILFAILGKDILSYQFLTNIFVTKKSFIRRCIQVFNSEVYCAHMKSSQKNPKNMMSTEIFEAQ